MRTIRHHAARLAFVLSLATGAIGAFAQAAPDGVRAQLVAVRHVVIASELAGKISSLPLREGQRFRQGEILVSYDCSLHRARLDRATQAEIAARKKLEVAEQLDQLASISKADVEQVRAALAVAQAESGVERAMTRRCAIAAPFSGRVGETFVRAAEHVAEGKELMSIYDDSAFEVQTIVPSRWLAWLKPGYPMQVSVEETGQTYTAAVARIAGTVDPVSQSVKVIGRLANDRAGRDGGVLLPGMSGVVRINPPAAKP
ncbi:MAG: efflux transporter periplasmic adaptor subunit [Candidatus Dactylopiibacterium carminicum]|uniref:Efflux RND transporter periplasmic adaptor subunit n=1 Tax=Candidatus Dactylopiibacterium carminicum TaxID=857335 RepID=A0A272ESF5_9RHOO|nr:efflux RND transporter periplasmic adaptor subunit [Candidatus Dactylopiibacterium carminicum]KAF7599012.1 efflux RND transporter periplasmic adaptor subunit [Candidatus Dactylopiibacterium carminicum]PAS93017.1 MAG: efflux transporter periplasmic adaptor subunit [Candidatus Dactylopiibacterium carminicum]PAS96691.1 MAG: efflux transporter periplasmic adaptor subunit [Candidatus Dactylopiibacterium carminicum]PAS99026.1 MAG: efflux transporter periplasmic adaptor subunit [Candidatus Dactylop